MERGNEVKKYIFQQRNNKNNFDINAENVVWMFSFSHSNWNLRDDSEGDGGEEG